MLKKFWLVVYNQETGDFSKSWCKGLNEDAVSKFFELAHQGFKVIHIGEGIHPKTYQSLMVTLNILGNQELSKPISPSK